MSKPILAYALASQPLIFFSFSGTTTTASQYLSGPGGIAADGIPVPFAGTLVKIIVFDGSNTYTDDDSITFSAGDRLSVFCQNAGSNFTVRARLNGSSTALQVTGVPFNSTLQVTLVFAINRV